VTTTAALYARPGPLVPSIADQLQTFATQYCWSTREFADEEVASHTSWDACLEALGEWQCRVLGVVSLDRLGLRLPVLLCTSANWRGLGSRSFRWARWLIRRRPRAGSSPTAARSSWHTSGPCTRSEWGRHGGSPVTQQENW